MALRVLAAAAILHGLDAPASVWNAMTNDDFHVGDLVRWDAAEGEVIGVIDRAEYREPRDAHRWRDLQRGVIVRTSDGEILHVRDAGTVLRKVHA